MKILLKPAVLLPILIGMIVGALLFIFGESEDAPGMCLLGLSLAFLLITRGLYNAGMIKKGFLAPLLLLCFGTGGVFLSIVLLLDGEFGNWPGLAFVGIAFGTVLIVMGIVKLRKARGSK